MDHRHPVHGLFLLKGKTSFLVRLKYTSEHFTPPLQKVESRRLKKKRENHYLCTAVLPGAFLLASKKFPFLLQWDMRPWERSGYAISACSLLLVIWINLFLLPRGWVGHVPRYNQVLLHGNKRSIWLSIFVSNDVLALSTSPLRHLVYALSNVIACI